METFTPQVVPEGGTSLSKTRKTPKALPGTQLVTSSRASVFKTVLIFEISSVVIKPTQGPSRSLPAAERHSPIRAGPGGGAVRRQGGDRGHRQGPGRGGHGEGPHHGPRTAASPVIQAGGLQGRAREGRRERLVGCSYQWTSGRVGSESRTTWS